MGFRTGSESASFIAVAILAVAFVVAGCGGSSEPSTADNADVRAIQKVGVEMTAAVRQDQLGRLCAMIDPAGLKKSFGNSAKCKKKLAANLSKLKQSASFTFSKVIVKGDRAVALNEDNEGTTVFLIRSGGAWKIDLNPRNGEFEPELDELKK